MNRTQSNFICCAVLLALLTPALAFGANKWTDPTPEELKMTSQPEVPGAAAVYLYREETTDDKFHVFSIYVRLKVLTEKGKEFSNVEVHYAHVDGGGGYTVDDVAGRTIHPDGTVIPFTGKPFDKLVERGQTTKYMAKVFTLPDVEVGSILEYRYTLRYDDRYFMSPQWIIQSDLFTRKAHYMWLPTGKQLITNDDRGQVSNRVAWTEILPKDSGVKQSTLPGVDGQLKLEVDVHDIPPAPDEEMMPPISSLGYRVLFYYTAYTSNADFWKGEGKHWSKVQDKFIGPGSGVSAAVAGLVSASDTQEQKLRKLYAAIMQMENTDFTREHSAAEEKSQGLKEIRNTDDLLARKRGDSDQLTELFVAMARAAGIKAYVMAVSDRDRHLFEQAFFSLSQLDDYVAIVTVDGKEVFLDPGSRYCPFGQLAWKHTMAGGLRQSEAGSAIAVVPPLGFKASQVLRVANLTMDEHGAVTGTVKMTYIGSPALHWRQVVLRQDSTTLEHDLQQNVERLLPAGMEVKVASIEKEADYEQPLVANFTVKGGLGSFTGKRVLLVGDVFESNTKPAFVHEKREVMVNFDYPSVTRDAVRINFPTIFAVESLPASDSYHLQTYAVYGVKTESAPTSVTFRREFDLAEILYKPEEYQDLRSFYGKMEAKDQENVVLKLAGAADKPGN